jgi:hypothetical protein
MPTVELEQKLEGIMRSFAQRIVVDRLAEFDAVWDIAIRVCDRYELAQCSLEQRLPAPLVFGK